jgi:hypothetical protein
LASCGNLLLCSSWAAYGFRASEDGNALEVSEPEMEVVWRIFRSVAEGVSVRSVRISLDVCCVDTKRDRKGPS